MRRTSTIVGFALALGTFATPASAEEPTPIDRVVTVIDELSELAEARAGKCDEMATMLGDHVATNKRRIERLDAKADTYFETLEGAVRGEAMSRVRASVERFQRATEACPAAAEALGEFMAIASPKPDGGDPDAPPPGQSATVVTCVPAPSDATCSAPDGVGFSKAKPLEWPISMAGADRLWYGRLQCADGTRAVTKRTGNVGQTANPSSSPPASEPTLDVIDEWEVRCGSEVTTLYVNTYRCGTLCAPQGFSIAPE